MSVVLIHPESHSRDHRAARAVGALSRRLSVQYGGGYGERTIEKQSREKEAEG